MMLSISLLIGALSPKSARLFINRFSSVGMRLTRLLSNLSSSLLFSFIFDSHELPQLFLASFQMGSFEIIDFL